MSSLGDHDKIARTQPNIQNNTKHVEYQDETDIHKKV